MAHYGEFVLMDYSEKVSTFRFYFGAITFASFTGFLTQFGALRNALDNITLGTIQKERWVGDEVVLDNIPPNDPVAHRELKWLVYMENLTSGHYFEFTIATPNPMLTIVRDGGQFANFSNPNIQAFITALENIIVDPRDGSADCIVFEMQIVGRDL